MKYLDETGLDKLIKIIKGKLTELSNSIAVTNHNLSATDTRAIQANSVANDAKTTADLAKAAIDAMTALTETEVESVWNSSVNDPTTPGEGNSSSG